MSYACSLNARKFKHEINARASLILASLAGCKVPVEI